MLKKIVTNIKGYSLIEIIVAVSIFVVVLFSATNIFMSVNNVQRMTIANQTNQDSVRYFMEVISKEIRQAVRSDDACNTVYGGGGYGFNNQVFRTRDSNSELYFKNKFGECVRYYLNEYGVDVGVIVREIEGVKASSTPDELIVENLLFNVSDRLDTELADIQPKVTFSFDIKYGTNRTEYEQALRMQTTVSSRNYRN
jgi:prepilin-type N-terminal cleavage/methylation domain-containing protein